FLNGVVRFSDTDHLASNIRHDLAVSCEIGVEFLLVGAVRANGGQKHPRVNPVTLEKRRAAGCASDTDVALRDRVCDVIDRIDGDPKLSRHALCGTLCLPAIADWRPHIHKVEFQHASQSPKL